MPRDEERKEGRFARHLRVAAELKENPKRIVPLARGAVLDIWRSRGGGFYGLGYLIAFIYLEIQMIVEDAAEAAGAAEFAAGQVLELLFRFSIMSFLNAFQALLWPLFVLQVYEGLGIILLIGSYFVFEHVCKPGIERLFPELKDHREQVAARKIARKETKKMAKEAKRSGGTSSQFPDQ